MQMPISIIDGSLPTCQLALLMVHCLPAGRASRVPGQTLNKATQCHEVALAQMASPIPQQGELKEAISRADFPENFVFGVGTSAYQVEGAANEGGRGPSIWDIFSHIPEHILDGRNGDVAVDQYHRYKEDVELIAKMGFDVYRFSISWSRIFPDGFGTQVNEEGIAYYNRLIDALLEKGIQPFVTLYHWDLPQKLQELIDGWLNRQIITYFAQYAETCFNVFGDRVKHWITLNEPLQTAVNGHSTGIFAPKRCSDRSLSPVGDSYTEPYLAAHNQLLAHATAVDIYRKKFQEKQGGIIGIVVDCEVPVPFTEKLEDKAAAQRRFEFQLGWYLDPLYFGDYPEIMRKKLGDRLPQFSLDEISLLRGSTDFVGINHYTTRYVTESLGKPQQNPFYADQDVNIIAEWEGNVIGETAASTWLYIVPWGIKIVLKEITDRYNSPPIYVTENGMDEEDCEPSSLEELLHDPKRVNYYKEYLAYVAEAIREGSDVRGYFAWSLLDNFEWAQGYTKRFGLVYVDYRNDLKRYPKSSALWFTNFLRSIKNKNQDDHLNVQNTN